MKRSLLLMGLVISLSVMLAGVVAFAQTQTQKCCIAGVYTSVYKDIPSKTCPKPSEEKLIMTVEQEHKCGSKMKGKITNPDGSITNFKGTATPGTDGCCNIAGITTKPGSDETVNFKATLCKGEDGKWKGNGTYTRKSTGEKNDKIFSVKCSGTFTLVQQ